MVVSAEKTIRLGNGTESDRQERIFRWNGQGRPLWAGDVFDEI
jgi:hypothetical protein